MGDEFGARKRRGDSIWVVPVGWERLGGAEGSATAGVWLVSTDNERMVVKRFERPARDFSDGQDYRRGHRWWRRELDMVRSGLLPSSRGLLSPGGYTVVEDESGVCLWSTYVPPTPIADEIVAGALGRFASQEWADPGWFTQTMLRDRVSLAEQTGGVSRLDARPELTASVLAASSQLWRRRRQALDVLDSLPQVLSHGDALPRNLLRAAGRDVVAIDWGQVGYNTIGADLATFSLYAATPFDDLLDAYLEGLTSKDRDQFKFARHGATLTAGLIAVSRAIRARGPHAAAYLQRLTKAHLVIEEAVETIIHMRPPAGLPDTELIPNYGDSSGGGTAS